MTPAEWADVLERALRRSFDGNPIEVDDFIRALVAELRHAAERTEEK